MNAERELSGSSRQASCLIVPEKEDGLPLHWRDHFALLIPASTLNHRELLGRERPGATRSNQSRPPPSRNQPPSPPPATSHFPFPTSVRPTRPGAAVPGALQGRQALRLRGRGDLNAGALSALPTGGVDWRKVLSPAESTRFSVKPWGPEL